MLMIPVLHFYRTLDVIGYPRYKNFRGKSLLFGKRKKIRFEVKNIFVHQSFYVRIYRVKGHSYFLLSHADLNVLGLSCHSLEKEIVSPEDFNHQSVI